MAIPLQAFVEFSSRDADAVREHMSSVFSNHRLDVANPKKMSAIHSFVNMRQTAISYLEYGTDVVVQPQESNYYVAHVPVRGTIKVSRNSESFVVGTGDMVVTSPTDRLAIEYGKGNGTLLLRIPRRVIEARLAKLLDAPLHKALNFTSHVGSHDVAKSSAWRRQFMFIVNELDAEDDGFENLSKCGEELEYSLINSLIFLHRNNYWDNFEDSRDSVAPYYVKAAEKFIRDNSDDFITVDDIVAASGISKRALYLGFSRFRSTTPMLFLQRVRLENVRRDILTARNVDSVTTIASLRGFTQLGRFSRLFQNAYGVLPSQLMREVRDLEIP